MSGYSIKVTPRGIIQLRSIADEVRKLLKINQLYFPIIEFIEFILPRLDRDFTLAILDKSEMDSNHGITYPDKSIIYLREDVYEGAVEECGRDRMTVAHEFGHYLLHRNVSPIC